MRPGLVAIGIGLLVLGGAVVVAVFEGTEAGPGQSTHYVTIVLPSGENASAFVWGLNGSGVAFSLSWHASGKVDAVLSAPSGCGPDPSHCSQGPVLVRWPAGTAAGAWSTSSPPSFPWLLRIVDPGPISVQVDVTTTAARAPVPAPVAWAYDIFLVAGAALAAIGALSLFLGLFLRGGIYRTPGQGREPVTSPGVGPPDH